MLVNCVDLDFNITCIFKNKKYTITFSYLISVQKYDLLIEQIRNMTF